MNNKRNIIFIFLTIVLTVLMAACKSTKNGSQQPATKNTRTTVSTVDLETEAMMVEAKMKQETGQVEQALRGYQAILTRNPKFGAALFEMATCTRLWE